MICPLAKFCVNVVVLLDNIPLVFFYFFSKTFQKNCCTAYSIKKIRTKLPTKKKNSCRGNFSTPPPPSRISNGSPLRAR